MQREQGATLRKRFGQHREPAVRQLQPEHNPHVCRAWGRLHVMQPLEQDLHRADGGWVRALRAVAGVDGDGGRINRAVQHSAVLRASAGVGPWPRQQMGAVSFCTRKPGCLEILLPRAVDQSAAAVVGPVQSKALLLQLCSYQPALSSFEDTYS